MKNAGQNLLTLTRRYKYPRRLKKPRPKRIIGFKKSKKKSPKEE